MSLVGPDVIDVGVGICVGIVVTVGETIETDCVGVAVAEIGMLVASIVGRIDWVPSTSV
jgi:hypothetical protein